MESALASQAVSTDRARYDGQSVRSVLRESFGFDEFREGQEAVVRRLVEGRSVLAVFPTGGGKSLCYQLPALVLDGLTVVISPLIALMKDQLDFLVRRGIPAARLDSSLTREETLAVYDGLHAGRLKMLYVSPERLSNERFLSTLRRQSISLLAIDEAHCISEWGHNFRPDYLKLPGLARSLNVGRVLALTATATPTVSTDIAREFAIDPDDAINTGFYRRNLHLRVTPCTASERDALLLARLRERAPGPTIVYVTLQRTAERVAALLSENGIAATAYHAGMKTEDRTAVQDMFMKTDRSVIVATIAFGMGVDKANIRYVYHYNLPKGLESYSQEIGRAGRDGEDSVCEMFACMDDVVVLENFSYGDTPEASAIASFVDDVLGRGESFSVAVHELSNAHDIRPLVVKTLLTYLELEQIIGATGPFYASLKFLPTKSSKDILAQFDGKRADLLRRVFRHAQKGAKWFSLDVDRITEAIGEPRDRIMAALSYLEETGDLELQAAGVRLAYRLLDKTVDAGVLCDELVQRFQRREKNDIGRIRSVLNYAEDKGCLTNRLLAYFGEARDNCGHCGRCAGEAASALPSRDNQKTVEIPLGELRTLQSKAPGALESPRQMARFLCGITSPATTRAKLKAHPLFGRFDAAPFHEVLANVEHAIGPPAFASG